MPRFSRLVLVTLSLFLAPAAAAQEVRRDEPRAAAPVVTASATADGARFTAPSAAQQLRLEVFSPDGAKLFDSGLRAGNVIDWSPAAAGLPLADGPLLFALTVGELSGATHRRHALAEAAGGRLSFRPFSPARLTSAQAQTLAEGEAGASSAVVIEEAAPGAVALTAHDGRDGRVVTTSGGLSFRSGDFFGGRDRELMRLTPDGDAEFAGLVTARGIRFADGTEITSAREAARLSASAADELPGPSNVTGAGTTGRLTFWSDGAAGQLGDSLLSQSGATVTHHGNFLRLTGTPSASVESNIIHLDSNTKTMGQVAGPGSFFGSGNGPYFILRGNAYSAIAGQRGLAIFSGGSVTSPVGREGSIQFNTLDQIRMLITPAGNVGIGLGLSGIPTEKLEVAGNVRLSGAGSAFQFADGSSLSTGNVVQLAPTSAQVANVTRPFIRIDGQGDNTGPFLRFRYGPGTITGETIGPPVTRFEMRNDGGFFAAGKLGVGTIPTTGCAERLMWYPFKGAFRAGGPNDGGTCAAWDDANIGFFSWAGGAQTKAAGLFTFAFGELSNAMAPYAFALGRRAQALHQGAFVWADDTTADFASTAAKQFLIRAAGGVGIGTASPQAQLHSATDVAVGPFSVAPGQGRLSVSGTSAELTFARRTLTSWPAAPAAGDRFAWYNPDGTARLWSNGDLLAVTSAGRLGLGVLVPDHKLHVIDAGNTGLRVQTDTAGGTVASFGGNGDFQIDAPFSPAGRFVVKQGGNVGVGLANPSATLTVRAGGTTLADAWTTRSSARLKTNVETLPSALDALMRLRGVSFEWKETGRRSLGFIAEEVGRVVPEAVEYEADGEARGLDYGKLTPVLVEAVKEQQRQIEAQRRRIEQLERRLQALESLLTARDARP